MSEFDPKTIRFDKQELMQQLYELAYLRDRDTEDVSAFTLIQLENNAKAQILKIADWIEGDANNNTHLHVGQLVERLREAAGDEPT